MRRLTLALLLNPVLALGCLETGQVLGPAEDRVAATDLSLGADHSCALTSGQLACWGGNTEGQLGVGDRTNRLVPTPLLGAPLAASGRWSRVTAGERHSCALDEAGDVFCWGANARGQLGSGTRDASTSPAPVELPGRALTLATRFNHSCALLADASLWCWGQNGEGELGQADAYRSGNEEASDALRPVAIPGRWRAVATGQGHSCGVQEDGGLWCWGRNTDYELGTEGGGQIQIRQPTRVGADTDWRSVDAGQHHGCALKLDRSLWCWGLNTGLDTNGGFPLGIDGMRASSPTRVGTSNEWTLLATHTFHTCAIGAGFELFCWGRNIEGQLGLGDIEFRRSVTRVAAGVSAVAAGRFHTCVLGRDGSVACAGKNELGQLGTSDRERRSLLTRVDLP